MGPCGELFNYIYSGDDSDDNDHGGVGDYPYTNDEADIRRYKLLNVQNWKLEIYIHP